MRLTDIKLSGFKSFVDPTHIVIPGQLVGVVGPNGCGKSNIIDAVRWVLGESSARHLRGDTMQDVIFSGSATRKPVNRASVELVFDNSLGKAGGAWAQYAEISVKRVLQREGDSWYYVNNTHVRRRDVADIFLGTGLGSQAYAIIEQGMISRIVEAKPEEIRVFLEEAAGVSKYKERRHETELRLSDTRKNLLRVDDVRNELDKQLTLLEEQAAVAEKYHELQNQLKTTQNLLWLLKKQDANAQQSRYSRDAERLSIELEAEVAKQREIEKKIEELRASHYTASDTLQVAQGELYASNAEIARLEQNIQFVRENRKRADTQIDSLQQQLGQVNDQLKSVESDRTQWQAELASAQVRVAALTRRIQELAGRTPQVEESFRSCQAGLSELRKEQAQLEQASQIEETKRAHSEKMLQQLRQRQQRTAEEKGGLQQPDDNVLEKMRRELESLSNGLTESRAQIQTGEMQLTQSNATVRDEEQKIQETSRSNAELQARLNALQQIQSHLVRGEKIQTWIAKHNLENLPRFWQSLRIEQGWEDALEAVLREQLNGIALADLTNSERWIDDIPPEKVTIYDTSVEAGESLEQDSRYDPLQSYVTCSDARLQAVLADWLHQVYVVKETHNALALRKTLPSGAKLVSAEGHIFTRYSVSFYAPDSELHHVLSRQREIEILLLEIEARERKHEIDKEALSARQMDCERHKESVSKLRDEITKLEREHYRLQLDIQKLTEQAEHVRHRSAQTNQELNEIETLLGQETELQRLASEKFAQFWLKAESLVSQMPQAEQAFRDADLALEQQRQALRTAENEEQQAAFDEKTCINKINELDSLFKSLHELIISHTAALDQARAEQANYDEQPLSLQLQTTLATRETKEQSLRTAREQLENISLRVQECEQERLFIEQKLNPLREKIAEIRLKEQEARILAEQYAEHLIASDEAELAAKLTKGTKANHLQLQIDQLTQDIGALGAVNLAALEQLHSSRERKAYLDSQALDLTEAITTLEGAIRRIDLDTRQRLQETFDAVNRNFDEMYATLFGGGHASLLLTGEEILDSGVQIIAQPPGKKNSSIHLLSGGEKALTALALVFALFRLNPAPFCLMDEVDAPLDDHNTERYCQLVKKLSENSQFLFISHNKITMEIADQLVGVTMQELGVSRVVAVDMEQALKMKEEVAA